MELGLSLPQGAHNDLRRDVTGVARAAEQAGFASLWAYERVLFPVTPAQGMYGVPGLSWLKYYEYCADPLTVLAMAGAVTEKVRLGTSVLVGPLHPTLALARALATLDQATGGRVIAGLGSGWAAEEYRAMGMDFSSRGRALDETIDGLRALLGPDPVTYRDSHIAVEEALVNPKPVTQIPILLGGGSSERAFRRIARKADGWLPVNMAGPALADSWKRLLDLAGMEGRDPQRMRLIPVAHVTLADRPAGPGRQPFQGILDEVIDDIAATAEAGADELIVGLDASVASSAELIDKALALMQAVTAAGLRNSAAAAAPASRGLAAGIHP
jgi:probable F420-dependent oxidoreductase